MCIKKRIPSSDDWRRQGQEDYLKNKVLTKRRYKPFREGWDHDHCEFCGGKFSLNEGDFQQGYSTLDGYHWICERCFDDFQSEFQWNIENSLP